MISKALKLLFLFIFLIPQSILFAQNYFANQTSVQPIIDGIDTDSCWKDADWTVLAYDWFKEHGEPHDVNPSADDFSGKFKSAWDENYLYVLVEITDDVLNDDITDPLYNYWEEDCLEIFVDENNSGGSHGCNFKAFAYHMAINSIDAIDWNLKCKAFHLNDYISFKMKEKSPNLYIWEVKIPIYTDKFIEGSTTNPTRKLSKNEVLGFSVAYCEDDGKMRENFFGSVSGGFDSSGEADVFGKLKLLGADEPETGTTNGIIKKQEFKIWPNPSKGVFTINIPFTDELNTFIRIRDIYGKIIWNERIHSEDNHFIDLSKQATGIYFVEMQNSADMQVQKVIIVN